jgi:hypothetical protein
MLPFEATISPRLKSLGFKKKARTWWRADDNTVQVVNLQKSAYGEQLYVNLGLYIRSLGLELSPPEYRCHMRARLERVVPAEFFEAVATATSNTKPSEALLDALLGHGVSWLEGLTSPAGRKKFLENPMSKHCFVSLQAREA